MQVRQETANALKLRQNGSDEEGIKIWQPSNKVAFSSKAQENNLD